MASKAEFEIEADQVEIQDLWNALTKDKVEVLEKAAPDLLTELRIVEGDGIGLGSLILVSFAPSGAAAPAVLEPFKERIVEFDETKHLLSFLGIEGGYMNLGFTHYLVSFKLDDIGAGKTLITSTLTYDLEQNFDGGAQLLDGFLNLLRYYLGSVVKYLQKLKPDPESAEGAL